MRQGAAASVLGWLPLAFYLPFRKGAVGFHRGHPIRSLCIAVVKLAAVAHRRTRIPLAVHPLDRPDISFDPADSMVMEAVYWTGVAGYEGCVPAAWETLCRRSTNILEIGGNVGFFTVVGGMATTGRYRVVEPVPRVASILQQNLKRNGLTSVELLRAAVIPGAARRDVVLNIPSEQHNAPVGAHLVEGTEVLARSSATTITVTGLPIQDLCIGCDLIKIDAEGIEFELLQDVRGMLLATKPTLLIEVLPEAEKLGHFLSELALECGYAIYVLPEYRLDAPVRVPAESFSPSVPGRYFSKDVVLTVSPL